MAANSVSPRPRLACNVCWAALGSSFHFRSCFHVVCRRCHRDGACPVCLRHNVSSLIDPGCPDGLRSIVFLPSEHVEQVKNHLGIGIQNMFLRATHKDFLAAQKARQFDMIVRGVKALQSGREVQRAEIASLKAQLADAKDAVLNERESKRQLQAQNAGLKKRTKFYMDKCGLAKEDALAQRRFGKSAESPVAMSTPIHSVEAERRGTSTSISSSVTSFQQMEQLMIHHNRKQSRNHRSSLTSPDSFHSASSRIFQSPPDHRAAPATSPSEITTPVLLGHVQEDPKKRRRKADEDDFFRTSHSNSRSHSGSTSNHKRKGWHI